MADDWGLSEREREALMFPPNHPARTGLTKLFEGVQKAEFLEVGAPSQSDGQRHYNAGRAAMLIEFETFLEALYKPTSEEGVDI